MRILSVLTFRRHVDNDVLELVHRQGGGVNDLVRKLL